MRGGYVQRRGAVGAVYAMTLSILGGKGSSLV